MKKQVTLEDLIKQGKITNITIDRVEVAKSYIEKNIVLENSKMKKSKKVSKKIYNNN